MDVAVQQLPARTGIRAVIVEAILVVAVAVGREVAGNDVLVHRDVGRPDAPMAGPASVVVAGYEVLVAREVLDEGSVSVIRPSATSENCGYARETAEVRRAERAD